MATKRKIVVAKASEASKDEETVKRKTGERSRVVKKDLGAKQPQKTPVTRSAAGSRANPAQMNKKEALQTRKIAQATSRAAKKASSQGSGAILNTTTSVTTQKGQMDDITGVSSRTRAVSSSKKENDKPSKPSTRNTGKSIKAKTPKKESKKTKPPKKKMRVGSEESTVPMVEDNKKDQRNSKDKSEMKVGPIVPKTDKNGHIIYKIGDVIKPGNFECTIIGHLGAGTFGKVVKVERNGKQFALKITNAKYQDAASTELDALVKILREDHVGQSKLVELIDFFWLGDHRCMLFKVHGISLEAMLNKLNGPFKMQEIRSIAFQICLGVQCLHDNRLTHTDLKPDNILFDYINIECDLHLAPIRVIDLSSATFDYGRHHTIVSTRNYRAPEIILEQGWAQPCDVWSIGCILFELYTGNALFYAANDVEHLMKMERVLGPFPAARMLEDQRNKNKFSKNGKLNRGRAKFNEKDVNALKPLKDYIREKNRDDEELFDLIGKMLQHNQKERITINDALKHPFITRIPDVEREMLIHGTPPRVNT